MSRGLEANQTFLKQEERLLDNDCRQSLRKDIQRAISRYKATIYKYNRTMRTFGRICIFESMIQLGAPPSQSTDALRLSPLLLSEHLLGQFHLAVSQLFLIVFFQCSSFFDVKEPKFQKQNIPWISEFSDLQFKVVCVEATVWECSHT